MNKTVTSMPYDFSVLEGNNGVIYHQVGRTSSSVAGDNIDVSFPSNYTGSVTIAFENLNDSSFASTEFPATVSSPSTDNAVPAASISAPAVPEFPFASLAVLVAMFVLMIPLSKFRVFHKQN